MEHTYLQNCIHSDQKKNGLGPRRGAAPWRNFGIPTYFKAFGVALFDGASADHLDVVVREPLLLFAQARLDGRGHVSWKASSSTLYARHEVDDPRLVQDVAYGNSNDATFLQGESEEQRISAQDGVLATTQRRQSMADHDEPVVHGTTSSLSK